MSATFAPEDRLLPAIESRSMPCDTPQMVFAFEVSKPFSILIVEDDPLIASYIEEVLAESGFGIAGIAASGQEALSLATERKPALALVDIRLTGPIDGVELACTLRERFDVRSIFLSGTRDAEIIERAKAARPLGFLHKPFLPSQVFNAIRGVLSRLGR